MWYWLRDLLVPQGIDLRLGHAKYLKAISYAKVKTDAVDAATLAQLLRVDLIPEAHMISPALRETRDLLRARLVLVSRRLRCQRSLGALLEKYNVGTPAELPELPRLEATLQAEQQALLKSQVRRIEQQLRDRVLPTPDAQRLVWIPGIGPLVAYTLLLEIDDITRFPTVRQFHSYCRLVPGADDSAATRRHKRSRDGNRYLKLAFHHAAVRAAQYFPEIQAEYRRRSFVERAKRLRAPSSRKSSAPLSITYSPSRRRSMDAFVDSSYCTNPTAVAPPGKPARVTGATERPHA